MPKQQPAISDMQASRNAGRDGRAVGKSAGALQDFAQRHATALLVAGVALAAIAFRLGLLNAPLHHDEMYHLFAAAGWLEHGRFAIADGVYERAWIYTWFVAQLEALFGPGALAPRLLSVACWVSAIVIVVAWVKQQVSMRAALIAAAFLIVWPSGIISAQFARFYALQALLVIASTIAVYVIMQTETKLRDRALLGIAAIAGLALATHLQPTTFVALLGIALWIGVFHVLPWIWRQPARYTLLAALAVCAIAAFASVYALGYVAKAWAELRFTAGWLAENSNDVLYYHKVLLDDYPVLWPLFPFAAVIALAARPQLASLCVCMVIAALAVHSLAGMKLPRYIVYMMPFMFIIYAIALDAILPGVWVWMKTASQQTFANFGLGGMARPLAAATLILALGFAIFANAVSHQALSLALGRTAEPLRLEHRFAWPNAKPVLDDWLNRDGIVISTNDMHALEYLGKLDLLYHQTRTSELTNTEFDRDFRTGRLVVGELGSLRRVLACHPAGVFVTTPAWWEFTQAGRQLRALVGDLVEIRRDADLLAFSWQAPLVQTNVDCATLPALTPVK